MPIRPVGHGIGLIVALASLIFSTTGLADETAKMGSLHAVRCEGTYPGHLQGACSNGDDALYWCFTTVLVKTDSDGHVVRKIDVATHHGDLCYEDGKLYVAVNLGKFNLPPGKEDSWVYVYDAESLAEVARHKVPELVHGAGGIAYHDGRFIVVGGLPIGSKENFAYEYDKSFNFQKRHVIASGYTFLGIQTVAYADDHWWFGCYGSPRVLLKTDRDFKLVGRWNFDASLGLVPLSANRFLVARDNRTNGFRAWLEMAEADQNTGLRIVTAP